MLRKTLIAVLSIASLASCASSNQPRNSSAPTIAAGTAQVTKPFGDLTFVRAGFYGYYYLPPAKLAESMANKKFTLVNVHVPYAGELEKTDLFIPFDQVANQLDKLPDKSAPIVLYCRTGSMSANAAVDLVKAGYTNVYDLAGGMNGWETAGQTLIKKAQ